MEGTKYLVHSVLFHIIFSLLSNGCRGALLLGVNRSGIKLTTHFHPVPRSRICGATPPLPIRLHGVVLSYAQGQIYLLLFLLYSMKLVFLIRVITNCISPVSLGKLDDADKY
jgi:hypothetical protein